MTIQKCLLMVGGGIETVPGIQEAKNMGLYVVVSDRSPNAPGFKYADAQILASTYDVEQTVEQALQFSKTSRKIDGVMSVATDVPLTVSAVAETLSLPGISRQSAWLATDKLAMKDKFKKDRIPIPWFSRIDNAGELERSIVNSDQQLILKPVDSRGGRGVLRIRKGDDYQRFFEESIKHSPSGRVMVEQYLPGPQVSTESIVLNGQVFTPGFSDRNYSLLDDFYPYMIEDGGDLPSHLSADIRKLIEKVLEKATRSLGIDNWVAKGDIVVSNGKPYVIELAARLSGGYFCTHEIPLNTGVNIVQAVIDLALGETVDPASLKARFLRPVVQRYLFPLPGRIATIEGVDEVRSWEGVELCEIRKRVGELVDRITCHPSRAGVIITTGETIEEARELALKAVSTIRIMTTTGRGEEG